MKNPNCPKCGHPLEEGERVVGFDDSKPCLICGGCEESFDYEDFVDCDSSYTETLEFNLTHS